MVIKVINVEEYYCVFAFFFVLMLLFKPFDSFVLLVGEWVGCMCIVSQKNTGKKRQEKSVDISAKRTVQKHGCLGYIAMDSLYLFTGSKGLFLLHIENA